MFTLPCFWILWFITKLRPTECDAFELHSQSGTAALSLRHPNRKQTKIQTRQFSNFPHRVRQTFRRSRDLPPESASNVLYKGPRHQSRRKESSAESSTPVGKTVGDASSPSTQTPTLACKRDAPITVMKVGSSVHPLSMETSECITTTCT